MKLPYDLNEYNEQALHDKMLESAPPGVDLSEGNMFYDHTRPSAIVISEYAEFVLPNSLMQKWPQTATGDFLDMHGLQIGLPRRLATTASGTVTIVAKEDVNLPVGTVFIALGDKTNDPLYFRTTVRATLKKEEEKEIAVTSDGVGTKHNLPDGAITIAEEGYTDVVNVVDSTITTPAIDDEDDETYRDRILYFWRNRPSSGTVNDYKIWAKEVSGVGDVEVESVWEGGGTVKVLITDSDGKVADEDLIDAVQRYIDPINGKGLGKAPIGAWVTVGTMDSVSVDVSIANLSVLRGHNKSAVAKKIKDNIDDYFGSVSAIKHNQVVSIIIKTEGVNDFGAVSLNGEQKNIELGVHTRATVGDFAYE